MNDFLKKILSHKKGLIEKKRAFYDNLKNKLQGGDHSRYSLFKRIISHPGEVNLIAEIKKASPSRGLICKEFSVPGLARKYVNSKAVAISVVTEEKFFLGKPPYVRDVSEYFKVPVLAKDFFVDEVQVYEAFAHGASAILLIVAILSDDEIKSLSKIAEGLDMDCLVEVHDDQELGRVIDLGCSIIGINNRNLKTFEVDFSTCETLIPKIPKDRIIVAESGIKTHDQIEKLKTLGAHAVLIGETFLRSGNVEEKIKEVMHGSN